MASPRAPDGWDTVAIRLRRHSTARQGRAPARSPRGLGAWLRASDRHRTVHRDAVHQPPLVLAVVVHREMLAGTVIPHDHVSATPFVAILKARLDHQPMELRDKRQRFIVGYAFDGNAFALSHVDRLAAGDG